MDEQIQRMIAQHIATMRRALEIHATALEELARAAGIEFTTEGAPKETSGAREYRPDGFSFEISEFGGRRHKAVDESVRELRRRGDFKAAASVPVWFVFGNWAEPGPSVELYPEDQERRDMVQHAVNEVGGEWILFAGYRRTPWFQPFRLKRDKPGSDLAERHAVVMLLKGWTPERAMKHHAERILEEGYFDEREPSPVRVSPSPPPGAG